MSKLRSVSTAFWSDPFIEDLTPSEKLLFLYLITNDKTNMLGIYEVSIKKVSFDTGLNKDIIEKALKEFERLSKVKYIKNHVVLVNFMKHQNYNTNMKKSAIDTYNNLPKELKDSKLSISKDNPLEGFESLLNHYGMVSKYEVEVEVEDEEETEVETKELEIILEAEIIYFSFDDFWSLYPNKINKANSLKSFNKIPKEDLETLEIHLNHFIANKPFKEYSYPHATTYLNQERYKDELTTNNNNDGKQIISSEQHGQIIKIINSDGVRR